MKWKKFTDEMPKTGKKIIIRCVGKENNYLEISEIKRPYDIQPNKYHPDYYEITSSFANGSYHELNQEGKELFQWLDPFQDLN